jgi:bacilliredoxin
MPSMYDREAVQWMWEELEQCGVKSLTTDAEVDSALQKPGTTLVVVNSVCGCAAGAARPGITRALQSNVIPDHLTAVFAGVDTEATERARAHMPKIPPSSPAVAIFKDGVLVYSLERRHIQLMNVAEVSAELERAFRQHCTGKGPSVSPEVYRKSAHALQCGSTIPRIIE